MRVQQRFEHPLGGGGKEGQPSLAREHEGLPGRERRSTLAAVPVTHEIALRTVRREGLDSKDPADRFLVATALEHGLTLVTAGRAIQAFRTVTTLW